MLTREVRVEQGKQIAIENAIIQVLDYSRTNGEPNYVSQPEIQTRVQQILGFGVNESSLNRLLIKLVNEARIKRVSSTDRFSDFYY